MMHHKPDFTGWEWWMALSWHVIADYKSAIVELRNFEFPVIASTALPATQYDSFVVHENTEI